MQHVVVDCQKEFDKGYVLEKPNLSDITRNQEDKGCV